MVFLFTMLILLILYPKNQNVGGLGYFEIMDFFARIFIICILFSYSYIFLKAGVFLFAYSKIFKIVGIISSTKIVSEIGVILETSGVVLVAVSLILLSRNVLNDQLFNLAFSDSLTGLMNRHAFLYQAQKTLRVLSEKDKNAAIIYVDLNKFKSVNDYHGHHTGDEVLGIVGKRIKTTVRNKDLIARFGGDEFVFFLPDSDWKVAEEVAKRVVEKISRPIIINGVQFCLGASAGIAVFPDDGKTVEELIKNADRAMYRAKNTSAGYMFSSQIEGV